MLLYFVKRILIAIPTFIISTFIIFIIINLTPGSIIYSELNEILSSKYSSTDISENDVNELKKYYEIDKPIIIRYLIWLGILERKIEIIKFSQKKLNAFNNNSYQILQKNEDLIIKKDFKIIDKCIFTDSCDNNRLTYDGDIYTVMISSQPVNQDSLLNIEVYKKVRKGILNGYFGKSFIYSISVIELIIQKLPVSVSFGLIGIFSSYLLGIFFGVVKSIYEKNLFLKLSNYFLIFLYSVPGWILGALLLIYFGTDYGIKLFPIGEIQPSNEIYNSYNFIEKLSARIYHMILPGISYSAVSFSTLAFLTYNSISENIRSDYFLTALSKGLSNSDAIIKHVLRNSLIPIFSRLGYVIGFFLAGSYFIEYIYNLDGIGKLVYESISSRDYPVLFAFLVVSVMIMIIGNIISDIIIAKINPRIKFQHQKNLN